MSELPPEIKKQLALNARNKIYGCVREYEQLREQNKTANDYYRQALIVRMEQIDRDVIFWQIALKRYEVKDG